MSLPNWKCLRCGKEFNPVDSEKKFDFNCSFCGSTQTVPNRLMKQDKSLKKPVEWENILIRG